MVGSRTGWPRRIWCISSCARITYIISCWHSGNKKWSCQKHSSISKNIFARIMKTKRRNIFCPVNFFRWLRSHGTSTSLQFNVWLKTFEMTPIPFLTVSRIVAFLSFCFLESAVIIQFTFTFIHNHTEWGMVHVEVQETIVFQWFQDRQPIPFYKWWHVR